MNEHTEQVVATYIQELLIEAPDETPSDQSVKAEASVSGASPLEKPARKSEGRAAEASTMASDEKGSSTLAAEIVTPSGGSMHSAIPPLMALARAVAEPSTRKLGPAQHSAPPSRLLEGARRAEVEKLLADSMLVPKPSLELQESTKPNSEPIPFDLPAEAGDLTSGAGKSTAVVEPAAEQSSHAKADLGRQDIDSKISRHAGDGASHSDLPRVESPLLQWSDNGRPVWAQDRFEVLLFQVAGLTLAVPLIALGHIHPITDELTPIFGQADWFMGLQPSPNGRIRCVNTALFVMPDRYNPNFVQTAKYVVSIDGMDWGLAVDQVQQPNTIDPDEVTWRSQRTKRPWLAGTVKAAMCALIDVPQMGKLLCDSEYKR